jgi:NADH-quinone oxidoreductase subunit C
MPENRFLTRLNAKFPQAIVKSDLEAVDPWIEVSPERIVPVCRFLREEPDLAFDLLNCITAIDYCEPDPKKAAKVDWEPHLSIVYHLSSIRHKHTLVIKATLPRWKDDAPGELPEIDSVAEIWKTANWHEREVYDLSGVRFLGHPDLARILLPEDWEGHPLRKDYTMPLEYHGIRGR